MFEAGSLTILELGLQSSKSQRKDLSLSPQHRFWRKITPNPQALVYVRQVFYWLSYVQSMGFVFLRCKAFFFLMVVVWSLSISFGSSSRYYKFFDWDGLLWIKNYWLACFAFVQVAFSGLCDVVYLPLLGVGCWGTSLRLLLFESILLLWLYLTMGM